MGIEINDDAVQALYGQVGEKVAALLKTTAANTADDDIDQATTTLIDRMANVGLTLDPAEGQKALEALRRGENYPIELH